MLNSFDIQNHSHRIYLHQHAWNVLHKIRPPSRCPTRTQIYAHSPSIFSQLSKKPLKNLTPSPGSKDPVVARTECMLS